jgi:hypothetical protein
VSGIRLPIRSIDKTSVAESRAVALRRPSPILLPLGRILVPCRIRSQTQSQDFASPGNPHSPRRLPPIQPSQRAPIFSLLMRQFKQERGPICLKHSHAKPVPRRLPLCLDNVATVEAARPQGDLLHYRYLPEFGFVPSDPHPCPKSASFRPSPAAPIRRNGFVPQRSPHPTHLRPSTGPKIGLLPPHRLPLPSVEMASFRNPPPQVPGPRSPALNSRPCYPGISRPVSTPHY